jgi:two-component system response regulator RegA
MVERTILLVDDEEKILSVFVRALSSTYHVLTATSASDAWPHIEAGVDVLVCDLDLAGESGLVLIRHAASAAKIPRIIGMSGVATPSDAFALAGAGALLFLEKPFTGPDLQAAIEEVCSAPPRLEPVVAAQLGARTLADVEDTVRRTMIEQAIARSDGNQQSAARMLGLTRQRVNKIIRGK